MYNLFRFHRPSKQSTESKLTRAKIIFTFREHDILMYDWSFTSLGIFHEICLHLFIPNPLFLLVGFVTRHIVYSMEWNYGKGQSIC